MRRLPNPHVELELRAKRQAVSCAALDADGVVSRLAGRESHPSEEPDEVVDDRGRCDSNLHLPQ